MKIIKKFLRLRKQNDSVKLITVLFVILLIFVIFTITDICGFYKQINKRTEYILTSSDRIEKIELNLSKIEEMNGNIAAGIEKDYDISFNGGEISISVKEFSQEYLAKCYGVTDDLFYLNNSAFALFSSKQNNFTKLYQKDEKKLNGRFQLEQNLNDSIPFAIKRGNSTSLYAKSGTVTVSAMFDSTNISGETSKSLEGMGFEIENKSDIELLKYNQNLFFVKLKYNFFIILLIALFIFVILKRIKNLLKTEKDF